MRFVKALIFLLTAVFLTWSGRECAAKADSKDVAVGSFGYVLTVPSDWTECPVDGSGSITLHLKVRPSERKGTGKTGVIGHFTVHVMDRKTTSPSDWVDYHLNYNMPSAHGSCRIDEVKKVEGGNFEGTLISADGLADHEGYGLFEALLFTEKHVLILSYLHDPVFIREAYGHITGALQSVRLSPDEAVKARLDYENGLSLGFESFGLFVSLPLGWLPDRRSARRDQISVTLPSGSMTVYIFKRTSNGLDGLLDSLRKKESGLSTEMADWNKGCGNQGRKMFRVVAEPGTEASSSQCIMGLHEKGAFALCLRSTDRAEQDLFEKTAAAIVLMNPAEARKKVRDAVERLKRAIKSRDSEAISEVLPFLSLHSENSTVARELIAGLNSRDERILAECATALGRIGSPRASKALEQTLKRRKAGETTRLACIEALSTIGGEREQEVLIKFRRNLPRTCTPEVRNALNQTLSSLTR